MKAISLFSGAGGMDVGFRKAGFNILWANDLDKDACKTYELNHGKIQQGSLDDFVHVINEQLDGHTIDCVFGGPPCQGFSVAGKMAPNDPRSKLVWSFMDVIAKVLPASFVMENVKALATLEKFRSIREGLFSRASQLGYNVELVILNAKDFGVPQGRERMFLVGVKGKANRFKRLIKQEVKVAPVLREVLLKVGPLGSVSNSRACKAKITAAENPILRKSPYAGMLFNGQGRPLNLNGFATTLPASMGGNRTPIIDEMALYDTATPWIEGYHSHLMEGGTPLEWKDIPSRLRRLSVDEAAAIQTFPQSYQFYGTQSSVFKQIGNAVPCELAYAVSKALFRNLQGDLDNFSEVNYFDGAFDFYSQVSESVM